VKKWHEKKRNTKRFTEASQTVALVSGILFGNHMKRVSGVLHGTESKTGSVNEDIRMLSLAFRWSDMSERCTRISGIWDCLS
jgi:hypothetical protein